MLLNTLKNEKYKKSEKIHLRPCFIVFFWCFFCFFWVGFLMPTLLVTAQPIYYLRPDKSE